MKKTVIFLVAAAIALLTGCVTEQPPVADSPEPPAHSGKFVSEYGSMTFNGDGESITVCFEDAFAQKPVSRSVNVRALMFLNFSKRLIAMIKPNI